MFSWIGQKHTCKAYIILVAGFLFSISMRASDKPLPALQCISADKAANSASPSFTALETIPLKNCGKIVLDKPVKLLLTLSSGWQFKAGTGKLECGGKYISTAKFIFNPNSIEVSIRLKSPLVPGKLGISGLQVQALDGSRVDEEGLVFLSVVKSGSGNTEIIQKEVVAGMIVSSFTQVPGLAHQLAFGNRPAPSILDELLAEQPVIICQDQFGTPTREGLAAVEMVKIRLSAGSGTLEGLRTLNIGTDGGNGRIAFSDLRISDAGEKRLMASSSSLRFAVTNEFTVSEPEPTTNFFADDPDLVCKL